MLVICLQNSDPDLSIQEKNFSTMNAYSDNWGQALYQHIRKKHIGKKNWGSYTPNQLMCLS